MNSVAELINVLESKGVRLHSHTGTLRVDAPQGTLTDGLRTILAERKSEIVAFLQEATVRDFYSKKWLELTGELIHLFNERASVLEYGMRIPRMEAERVARLEVQASSPFVKWNALDKPVG